MKKAGAATAGITLTSGCLGSAPESTSQVDSFRWMMWGGSAGEAAKKTLTKPFEEEFGIETKQVALPGAQKMISKLKAGSLDDIDLVSHWNYTLYRGVQSDLFEPLNLGDIPNSETILSSYRPENANYDPGSKPHYVPWTIGSNGLVYNHNKVSKPKEWDDILDNDEMNGKISFPGYMSGALGVAAKDVGLDLTNLGTNTQSKMDKVWERIKGYNSDCYNWWSSGTQMEKLLSNNSVFAGSFWGGRTIYLNNENDIPISYTIPEDGTSAWIETWSIPKGVGSKRKEAAQKFMNFALREDRRTAYAEELYYTMPYEWKNPPKIVKNHPDQKYMDTDRIQALDSKTLEKHRVDWNQTFQETISK